MKYAFFDFGSTSVKFYTYDTNDKKIANELKVQFPENISKEINAFEVGLKEIDEIIDGFARLSNENDCQRILISVQMHGFIAKFENGFSNYVSWQDKTADINDKAFENVNWNIRGTSKKQNLPILKMKRFLNKNFELFTLGSYIAWRLCKNNCTHITDSAASGFFNAESGKREDAVYKEIKLPKTITDVEVIGKYENIEILSPVGDHQISYFGSFADESAYFLNIGTASQISVLGRLEREKINYEARPYFYKGIRLCTITGLLGGKELRDGIESEKLFSAYKTALEKLPKKDLIYVGGGACDYYKETIETALKKLNLKYEFVDSAVNKKGMIRMAENLTLKVGTMLSEIPFTNFPIIIKKTGLDFFILDNEHGSFDYSTITALAMNTQLIDSKMIVRLSDNTRMNITKFCDAGVRGFLLPMTNDAKQIEQVIEYAMYYPVGKRGISTTRAHTMYNPPKLTDYMKSANEKMEIYAQIETKQGVENVEEILKVNGLKGVIIGPNDLSCDIESLSDKAPVIECIKKVALAAKKAGKICGIITTDKDYINTALEYGAAMVSYGSELNMIINTCKSIKEKFDK